MSDTHQLRASDFGISHRFPGFELVGDEEGLLISNYQSAGEHVCERMIRCAGAERVLEICTGIGATTCVLASYYREVISIDKNQDRQKFAQANLKIGGLADRVTFLYGDALEQSILEHITIHRFNAIYADVDWSTTGNWRDHAVDIDATSPKVRVLYETLGSCVTKNICFKLPKTIDIQQVRGLGECEIEAVRPNGRLSFYLVYFGELAQKWESSFTFDVPQA